MRHSQRVQISLLLASIFCLLASPSHAEKRCRATIGSVDCDFESALTLLDLDAAQPREVHWQVPLGEAPEAGWPAVLFFHDLGTEARDLWTTRTTREQRESGNAAVARKERDLRTRALATFLEEGFAVITPQAARPSAAAPASWQSNMMPWAFAFGLSTDRQLVLDLLEAIANREIEIDPENLFLFGSGNGGMMASRLAVEMPEFWNAAVLQSATYATCFGVSCAIPEQLDPEHPPTLFLHGQLDLVTPVWTMEAYAEKLEDADVPVSVRIERWHGHGYTEEAGGHAADFFSSYLEVGSVQATSADGQSEPEVDSALEAILDQLADQPDSADPDAEELDQ